VALDTLGIKVSHYYSSEICKDAIAIQRKRFHGRITEIGCVTACSKEFLDRISPIDLLIGGSPCAELSRVNPKRKVFGKNGELYKICPWEPSTESVTSLFLLFKIQAQVGVFFSITLKS